MSRSKHSRMQSTMVVGLGVAIAGLGLGIEACQDTSATGATATSGGTGSTGSAGSGGNGAGGGAATAFTPKGCGFQISPRPEYKDFTAAKNESTETPKIRRVRLGLGGNVQPGAKGHADPATSAGFAWQTDDGTPASDVAWGADPDPKKWDAANRTSGVTWLTPQGDLNAKGDERMHEAYVCGLKPATTYYYHVGGGATGSEVWSDVYSFTTTPADAGAKITIGLTGDSRGEQDNAWQILQQRMHDSAVTLQLFSGDMINLAPDQGEWEQWLDSAWKDANGKYLTLAQTLTLSAHGNHDNHTALFFGNMVLPQDVATYPKYGELFFSVDVGPAHVVVLDDAFIVNPDGDADYKPALDAWLNADLTAANKNRANVPWILVMHHHPEFSSSLHGKDADVLRGRNYFAPIWDKYHVDLSIAGHDHDYERSKPLTGPGESPTVHTSFADGTVYVVCAGSGADGYGASTSNFSETSHDFKNGGALGLYSLMTIDKTSLKLEAHELRGDASDPVFDTVTITKP